MPDEDPDRTEMSQGTRSFAHAAQQKMICNRDKILVGDVPHQLFYYNHNHSLSISYVGEH